MRKLRVWIFICSLSLLSPLAVEAKKHNRVLRIPAPARQKRGAKAKTSKDVHQHKDAEKQKPAAPTKPAVAKLQSFYYRREYYRQHDQNIIVLRFTSGILPPLPKDLATAVFLRQLPEVEDMNFDPTMGSVLIRLHPKQQPTLACDHFLQTFQNLLNQKGLNILLQEAEPSSS